MKYVIYILVICSMIGSYFNVNTGITYEDVACVILLVLSIFKCANNKWTIDRFCKLSALYIPFMIFSALLNGELTNTVFINYFRNYTWGILVYFALANNIKSLQDINKILLLGIAFLIVFMLNFRIMMQSSFSENLATLDFEYGRNNVAFTALLFSILFEFLYYSKLVKSYVLLGVVVMTVIIVFCTSRYSMMMLVISYVVFRIFSKMKLSASEMLAVASFIFLGPLLYEYIISFMDSSFYESSQSYLNEKLNDADGDFWNSRIMDINVKPIQKMLNDDNVLSFFVGNTVSIQHSFFSHTLITTGVLGFLCYLITNTKLLVWTFKYKGVHFFLFIMVMVMACNDFITNARFIIGLNSVFYGSLCAIMYRYIALNENANLSK